MTFRVTGASIPGYSHIGQGPVLIGKNNQDAFKICPEEAGASRTWDSEGPPLICIISDGVSSAPDAEVGSKLAVRLYTATLSRELVRVESLLSEAAAKGLSFKTDPLPASFWKRVDDNALSPLSTLMMALGHNDRDFRQTLSEMFIFTILGILHTEKFGTWIFGPKGSDGVYVVNGEINILKPQSGNKPISPCYRFVPNEFQDQPELMQTTVHRYLPPGKLDSFLIGTDGVEHYLKAVGKKLPGKEETVHPLNHLWENDDFFDSDSLLLYFRQLNMQSFRINHPTDEELKNGKRASMKVESRLLLDDLTIVMGKVSAKSS